MSLKGKSDVMLKRFVLETNNQEVINVLQQWQVNDPDKKIKPKIFMISEYDKEVFNKQMQKIHEALKTLLENKISEDILIAYIRSKNIPTSMAKAVLNAEKEFFVKMGVM
jgi:hypothetical protein